MSRVAAATSAQTTVPASSAPSAADRRVKRERMLQLLGRRGADSIVLHSHAAVAWYLDGARTHVSLAGDPIAAVVVRHGGDELRVFANEADRLLDEELGAIGDLDLDVTRVPWHDVLAPAGIAALAEDDVAAELRAARASLLPAELARYRALGREVAEALTDAADSADPAASERDVAARLGGDLIARGIDPLVILVAGRSRLGHRHPLPTGSPIGDRAMLVACGRRHGLIANATRWVRSGGRSDADAEADAERRILEVEAAFFASTLVGATIGEAFRGGIDSYARHGFGSDEWRRHHQGGAAGYAGRDPRGTAVVSDVVQQDHAFAWNPTAPGAKVEDTVLVRTTGVEVLTVDPRWPTIEVAGIDRPIELERVGSG
ncbi:M24 family metallopeptidase [Agromyces albus]|uniref:M24 family metallopeptidase n=1 Tax=Agromyces albus TaxID=205332 RepID=UPI0027864069|nr:peptidase M24 [Agromyces albus]MDQ0574471.1 Xaa-Pro aminopeptidase [Agromyces albus]